MAQQEAISANGSRSFSLKFLGLGGGGAMRAVEKSIGSLSSACESVDIIDELRFRIRIARTIEEAIKREGVGGKDRELDLRRAWAECDALAERIAALRPSTIAEVKAKAAVCLWYEGCLLADSEEMRARLVSDVLTFLAGDLMDAPLGE